MAIRQINQARTERLLLKGLSCVMKELYSANDEDILAEIEEHINTLNIEINAHEDDEDVIDVSTT